MTASTTCKLYQESNEEEDNDGKQFTDLDDAGGLYKLVIHCQQPQKFHVSQQQDYIPTQRKDF